MATAGSARPTNPTQLFLRRVRASAALPQHRRRSGRGLDLPGIADANSSANSSRRSSLIQITSIRCSPEAPAFGEAQRQGPGTIVVGDQTPDLTHISAIAVAPGNSDIIWVGTIMGASFSPLTHCQHPHLDSERPEHQCLLRVLLAHRDRVGESSSRLCDLRRLRPGRCLAHDR